MAIAYEGGGSAVGHGVRAIPSHSTGGEGRAAVFCYPKRCAAKAECCATSPRTIYEALPRSTRAGVTGHRRARHCQRNASDTKRACLSGHDEENRRVSEETVFRGFTRRARAMAWIWRATWPPSACGALHDGRSKGPIFGGGRPWRACTPRARRQRRACMGPIAWPAIPCSKDWFSAHCAGQAMIEDARW